MLSFQILEHVINILNWGFFYESSLFYFTTFFLSLSFFLFCCFILQFSKDDRSLTDLLSLTIANRPHLLQNRVQDLLGWTDLSPILSNKLCQWRMRYLCRRLSYSIDTTDLFSPFLILPKFETLMWSSPVYKTNQVPSLIRLYKAVFWSLRVDASFPVPKKEIDSIHN